MKRFLNFFSSFSAEDNSKSEIAGQNNYAKHFPDELYSYLNQFNLLDGKKHSCNIKRENGEDAQAEIQVSFEPSVKNCPAIASLNIELKQNQDSLKITNAFSSKNWYLNVIITPDGMDFLSGNRKSCPITGLSDEECAAKTPYEVDHLISMINSFLSVNSVVENKMTR